MKTIVRDENDPVGGPAQKMATLFEEALATTLARMMVSGNHNSPDYLYVAAMAIASATQIAGKIMTMPEGNSEDQKVRDWADNPVSRVGMLVACLLVARCAKPAKDGGMSLDFEFGPRHVLAAIKAAEQLVGHNIDNELSPGMVKAARTQAEPSHLFDNSNAETVDLSMFRTIH